MTLSQQLQCSETTRIPWFGWTGNDEAATTDDWIDEEGLAFIIHPANALALAAATAGGNGCIITPKGNISSSEKDDKCSYIDNLKKKREDFDHTTAWAPSGA